MINKILLFMVIISSLCFGSLIDCKAIIKEVQLFQSYAPSGLNLYKDQLQECGIEFIKGIPINDYFKTEKDVLLMYSYLGFKNKMTHTVLLNYMILNDRWDLLLKTLDMARKMKKSTQILLLNKLFYVDLPPFFSPEMKEMFNFFTESEKLTISQQLIPNNAREIKYLNKKNNYIYEFWPLFDQMVFINHLRELFPFQFEKLSVFWREKLVSYYYKDVENQDPSFKLLSKLLNQEIESKPVKGANRALQAYYYLKTNQLQLLEPIIRENKLIFFNLIRYFDLYSSVQQSWLLSRSIPLTISDIEQLYLAYFYQIDSLSFKSWVWDKANDLKFNLETYLLEPQVFLQSLPNDKKVYLKSISPITNWVQLNQFSIQHFFNHDPTNQKFKSKLTKEEVSTLSRFYNDFKVIPFKSSSRVIRQILPYIEVTSHQEFLDLIPFTSQKEQLDLVQRFDFLETMPTKNQAEWTRKIYKTL